MDDWQWTKQNREGQTECPPREQAIRGHYQELGWTGISSAEHEKTEAMK